MNPALFICFIINYGVWIARLCAYWISTLKKAGSKPEDLRPSVQDRENTGYESDDPNESGDSGFDDLSGFVVSSLTAAVSMLGILGIALFLRLW